MRRARTARHGSAPIESDPHRPFHDATGLRAPASDAASVHDLINEIDGAALGTISVAKGSVWIRGFEPWRSVSPL
jgi:hypothetical protein